MSQKEIILDCKIEHDEYTAKAAQFFDVPITDRSIVKINNNINLPDDWQIGLIYGPSGCGKSTILKEYGTIKNNDWDNSKSIISNFNPIDFEEASKCLSCVGLASIPSWFRPYNVLSNGEKFRADLAKHLLSEESIILVDEFTSVVDRNVARSTSNAVSKWIRGNKNKKVIFASCHEDIIEWLTPDWVYNPVEGIMHMPRGCLHRPKINLQIFRAKYEAWELFKHHHYLSADLNKAAKLFVATWNDVPVACIAIIALPNPYLKNAWRASRTVVLPDYQGLGIGVKLSDYFGSLIKAGNGRFFSKTIHPAMIAYRLKHKANWKETTHSREARKPLNTSMLKRNWYVSDRFCFSFEYVGDKSSEEESKLFWEKV